MNFKAMQAALLLIGAEVIHRANLEGRFEKNREIHPNEHMRVESFSAQDGGFEETLVVVTTERWHYATYPTREI